MPLHAAQHRNAHRARHNHDMRGQRTFFEYHTAQPALVIFEQFGWPQIARNQDRIFLKPKLRRSAHLPRDDAKQTVGEILQIVHPVGEQRIVNLPHPHPGALLDAFDSGFGGQAAVDGLVDPAAPAFVIGEHLVGRDDLFMFAAGAEIDLARHPVNLLAHLVERGIDALALGLGVLGNGMFDANIGLVENRNASRRAFDQAAVQSGLTVPVSWRSTRIRVVNQVGIGDQFGQHHRHRLQRLDLDLFIFARLDMLHRQARRQRVPSAQ